MEEIFTNKEVRDFDNFIYEEKDIRVKLETLNKNY